MTGARRRSRRAQRRVHSHPAWQVRRFLALWGVEEAIRTCAANNTVPPVTFET